MAEYPLYVNAYGKIKKMLLEIKTASVPTKFNQDYLDTVLGFKSSNDRALIPLLKRIGFLNPANEPTASFKNFRDSNLSGSVMAEAIKLAYPEHYKSNEFAHKLSKEEFTNLTKRLTGSSDEDQRLPSVTGTFFVLKEFADFEKEKPSPKEYEKAKKTEPDSEKPKPPRSKELGISYTINLNLPATTNIEVFNSIFKSLKEHLLEDD
jgi:hypothetical protein